MPADDIGAEPVMAEGSYDWWRIKVERLQADVQAALAERDQQFERKCEALRARDEARRELADIKRVTEPPTGDEGMLADPAELREMWDFINRQARWQWHMAAKFNSKLDRVRALRDHWRRTHAIDAANELSAALDAPQYPENTTTPAQETA